VFSSTAAMRLRHTLYFEDSRFSQPLEGGFGEQLLRKVYLPLAGVAPQQSFQIGMRRLISRWREWLRNNSNLH